MKGQTLLFGILVCFSELLLWPAASIATQGHAGIEGLYTHQLAHIFFAVSMAILIYWLRQRHLVQQKGWRYIQYSAFFFILWNLDAFTVHLLGEQLGWIEVSRVNAWDIQLNARPEHRFLIPLYYLARLDHLLCVPALLFLYAGLRRLLKAFDDEMPASETS
jgi:hypothetical protein